MRMVSSLRVAAALGIVLLGVALSTSAVAARELDGLSGSAMRVFTGLTEPGALLVWGTVLAAVARAVNRSGPSE